MSRVLLSLSESLNIRILTPRLSLRSNCALAAALAASAAGSRFSVRLQYSVHCIRVVLLQLARVGLVSSFRLMTHAVQATYAEGYILRDPIVPIKPTSQLRVCLRPRRVCRLSRCQQPEVPTSPAVRGPMPCLGSTCRIYFG